jgi:hypothetical protein
VAAVPSVPVPGPEPLRLPHGSVRGTIAIFVTVTYGYLLLQGGKVPAVIVNAVVVVIAFYFGTHTATSRPAVPPGQTVPRPPRLVRALLLIGFAGLALWFLSQHLSAAELPPQLVAVLEVLAGYVLGMTASWIVHRRAHLSSVRTRLATAFRDIVAAGALALTAYICFSFVTVGTSIFASRTEDALSLVVTFYFGSRVIGH